MSEQSVIHILIASVILITVFGIFLVFFIIYLRSVQNAFQRERRQFIVDNGMVEEAERVQNELVKEIHDNIIQTILLLKMQLGSMGKGAWDEKHLRELKNSTDITERVINDAGSIVVRLNTDYISTSSLITILEHDLDRMFKRTAIRYDLDLRGNERKINRNVKTIIYRIIMEAIINVRKHSDASSLHVILDFQKRNLKVLIKDDGCGIPSEKLYSKNTSGIENMRHRAKLINAELLIESKPGAGCIVILSSPV